MKPLKEHSKQVVKGEELNFSLREISTMVNQTFQNIKQLHLLADKVFSLVFIVKEQIMLKLIAGSKKRLLHCDYCKKFDHNEKFCRLKNKQPQLQQQANISEEDKDHEEAEEHSFMALQTSNNFQKNTWLIDIGCTSHMTKYLSIFSSIDHTIRPKIKLGNGDIVQAKGRGTVKVSTTKGTKVIKNVLYIPELNQNLLSVA